MIDGAKNFFLSRPQYIFSSYEITFWGGVSMDRNQFFAICSSLAFFTEGVLHAVNPSITESKQVGANTQQTPVFEQGAPIENQYLAGYNQAGGVKLNDDAYDFYVTGSFIYWMANTDGFNISSFPIKVRYLRLTLPPLSIA